MVNIKNIKVSEMLLYANNGHYYGDMISPNLLPQEKATLIVTALKRIKYIQNALESIDYYLNRWDEVNLSDTKTQKALFFLLQDVKASPLEKEKIKNYLQEYFNKNQGKKDYGSSLEESEKKGEDRSKVTTFVRNIFANFYKEQVVFDLKNSINDFITGIKNDFGVNSKLKQAIEKHFYKEIAEDRIKKQDLYKSFLTKKNNFEIFLKDSIVQQLLQLSKTEPLVKLYNQAAIGKINLLEMNYYSLPEFSQFIQLLLTVKNRYEKVEVLDLQRSIQATVKRAGQKKHEDEQEEIVSEIRDDIREMFWNGSFDNQNFGGYINTIATREMNKLHKNSYRFDSFKEVETIEESESGDISAKYQDKSLEAFTFIDLNEFKNYDEEETKKLIFKQIAPLIKPYEEKRKEKEIHVALCFLEELGDYDKIAIRVYGDNNKGTKARARKAKENGKNKLIKDNSNFERFFELIEKYSNDKKNDNGTKF